MAKIIPIDYQTDSHTIFLRVYNLPYACWLDSGKPYSQLGRYDIISAMPAVRLVTQGEMTLIDHYYPKKTTQVSKKDPLELIKQELSQLDPVEDTSLPFSGGAIGYFSYDFGRRNIHPKHVQTKPASTSPPALFAEINIGIYHWAIIQDHQLQLAWFVYLPQCDPNIITTITSRLASTKPDPMPDPLIEPLYVESLNPVINREKYLSQVKRIHEYILAGDCYQVNFTQCFQGNYTGKPYSAYQALRKRMASPFCAYLQFNQQAIMSLSPERFLQVKGKQVVTQPIKGTAPRHPNPTKDHELAQQLAKDSKNQAENLMIVDLLRNDLGRHCIPGTISVDELFALQAFPNVHHLVSTISGQLKQESHSLDLFRDCFPGGSITGAPKKRAMEIIDELESGYRGVYCGSIGYINTNGDMDTNIAIRTVSCDGQTLYCWGGGGIVADSQARAEYHESLNKINALLQVLQSR